MKKKRSGFTLIEIMLVLILIGILTGMVVPRFAGRSQKAKIAATKTDIEANIATALDMFELDNEIFPTTEQGLTALIIKPSSTPVPDNWNGPYLKKKKIPVDSWGNPYTYKCPGFHNQESYDLHSQGPDKIDGTDDDIRSWDNNLQEDE